MRTAGTGRCPWEDQKSRGFFRSTQCHGKRHILQNTTDRKTQATMCADHNTTWPRCHSVTKVSVNSAEENLPALSLIGRHSCSSVKNWDAEPRPGFAPARRSWIPAENLSYNSHILRRGLEQYPFFYSSPGCHRSRCLPLPLPRHPKTLKPRRRVVGAPDRIGSGERFDEHVGGGGVP